MKHPPRQSARSVVGFAIVRTISARATRGFVDVAGRRFPCALGRSGVRTSKREGDGASPAGRFSFDEVFYRPDRVARPVSGIAVRRIKSQDGWCDAPRDRNYNRLVGLPYPASTETMCRADALYDLVVILGYNRRPRVMGRGSAIFMHVAKPGYPPTEGCIALSAKHLRAVLACLGRASRIQIGK